MQLSRHGRTGSLGRFYSVYILGAHPLTWSWSAEETGASIYSCSPEAKVEFPSLDPNVISASKYHDQVLKTKYRGILTAGIFKFPSPVVCKIR